MMSQMMGGGMDATTDPYAQATTDPYAQMHQMHAMQMQQQQAMMMDYAQQQAGGGGAPGGSAESVNSKGFPVRPGAQVCQFYAKTGDCKFGPTCKWDHSEAAIGAAAAAYGGMVGAMDMNSLGYPVRPGAQPCTFFVKTGTCSYGMACKWDHPEEYTPLAANHPHGPPPIPTPTKIEAPAGFNTLGYPVREGTPPCQFFMNTGSCSYGAKCKWDHPEGMGGSKAGYGKAVGGSSLRSTPY